MFSGARFDDLLPLTYQHWRYIFMIIFVILPCHSLLLTERFLLHNHLEGLNRSLRLIFQHELTRMTRFEHANHVQICTTFTC